MTNMNTRMATRWTARKPRSESLAAEELRQRGRKAEDLARRRKGDKHKRKIALRLRRETTMTCEWIAQRLKMGAAGYAANCVRASNEGA
jgi:hypothetical protein